MMWSAVSFPLRSFVPANLCDRWEGEFEVDLGLGGGHNLGLVIENLIIVGGLTVLG